MSITADISTHADTTTEVNHENDQIATTTSTKSPMAPHGDRWHGDVDAAPVGALNRDHKQLLKKTGTAKTSQIDALRTILEWPGTYMLADAADELLASARTDRRGRRSAFPSVVMLFMVIGTRACGSEAAVLTLVSEPRVWKELGEVFTATPEARQRDLRWPAQPPNRDQLRYFISRLIGLEGWHDKLQAAFQRFSIGQAQLMGNLNHQAEVDWANPDLRNAVIGDGTVIRPLSDVTRWVHPITGEVLYRGTRAKERPRVSPAGTDLHEDGKEGLTGLNMVHLLTATTWGWVILGTGHAEGAEQWAALDLLDAIATQTKGIHTLLWDRVFTGWVAEYPTGRYGILVVNKVVADTTRRVTEDYEYLDNTRLPRRFADDHLERITSEERAQQQLADYLEGLTPEQELRVAARLVKDHLAQASLLQRYYSDAPLPLGVQMYESTSAATARRRGAATPRIETVRSAFAHLKTHTHQGADGPCTHELYVDDGGLFTVEYDPDLECLVKTATGRCLSSRPRSRKGGDRKGRTDLWHMPCPAGDFHLTLEVNPDAQRPRPGTPAPRRQDSDRALSMLRPINRAQAQQFADHANFRNNAESFNHWYQSTLPNYGRAARLSIPGQQLDYLAAACLRNALTLAVYLADTRRSTPQAAQ